MRVNDFGRLTEMIGLIGLRNVPDVGSIFSLPRIH